MLITQHIQQYKFQPPQDVIDISQKFFSNNKVRSFVYDGTIIDVLFPKLIHNIYTDTSYVYNQYPKNWFIKYYEQTTIDEVNKKKNIIREYISKYYYIHNLIKITFNENNYLYLYCYGGNLYQISSKVFKLINIEDVLNKIDVSNYKTIQADLSHIKLDTYYRYTYSKIIVDDIVEAPIVGQLVKSNDAEKHVFQKELRGYKIVKVQTTFRIKEKGEDNEN